MAYKFINIFLILSLLLISLATASRPHQSTIKISAIKDAEVEGIEVEEASCEGVGKEECLMRRTLAAHIDYIYTGAHPPRRHH
ncbi:phytosulfokines [Sesamum indicum]|uniref:Phytosulfokine n=1 Tax=Sesamum indicum TaxID=4182 RepID=A0A6I9SVP4_SESIN|nr:phytosulfokines [Sesamum indicum]